MNKKRVTSKKYKPQIIVVEKTLQDMIDIEERLLEVVSRIEAKDFKETI
jgi:DNA polymerase II large subunit